jgi:redox-sensitive bicupin YhaK (pirin superfamily)
MATKNVETIVAPPTPHYVGDGFRVHNFIPGNSRGNMQKMSPFIMLDYNSKFYFSPSNHPKGVGVHPHKGFETVTIAYKGKVAHGDSAGNHGIIGEGDVQWMTAGSGILHKEHHEEEFSKTGGDFQMVQLWVNLPAKDKSTPPKYQEITKANIKSVQLADDAGVIDIIAGEYQNTKGAASTFTPIHLLNAKLNKGAKADFSFPSNYNTALLVVEGKIKVNGLENVNTDYFVFFKNDGEDFFIEASENALVLVLSGEPINEPIAAQGPFVMNTREELIQAFEDFNNGKFGYLA